MSMYQQLKDVWAELIVPGGPFEIAEIEVRGNSLKTYATAPLNLRDVWRASAEFAERDYLVYADERISYAQAHQMVASVANWRQDQGIQPGDRVAIAMRNYPEWLLAYWATVFGVPDDRLGEEVGVAILCGNGDVVSPDELRAH